MEWSGQVQAVAAGKQVSTISNTEWSSKSVRPTLVLRCDYILFYCFLRTPRISKQDCMEGGCDYDLSRSQSVFSVHKHN